MSWTFEPEFDAAHRAALESGKSLIYVCPPAPWAVRPLLDHLAPTSGDGIRTLVLAPDASEALQLLAEVSHVESLSPAYAVTGLARTSKCLKAGGLKTLVAAPSDAMQLVTRSSLRLESVERIVVCWPEAHIDLDHGAILDALLGECGDAQRLIVTADESSIGDFLERHARRAPLLAAARPPKDPGPAVRYAVTPAQRVAVAVRAALDVQSPESALVWDPSALLPYRWIEYRGDPTVRVSSNPGSDVVDLAIAVELPTAEVLAAIREIAHDVIVLVRPRQLGYLNSLADRLTIVRLRSEVDTAQDWRAMLRSRVRDRVEDQAFRGNLLALAPLFDEYDPALVAAAILDLPEPQTEVPAGASEVPHWVHLHLNLGTRDRLRTGDVVGALLNAAGLTRDHIGRVDMRETFTVVEVRAEVSETARRGMDGIVLRGRTVVAKFDRK